MYANSVKYTFRKLINWEQKGNFKSVHKRKKKSAEDKPFSNNRYI